MAVFEEFPELFQRLQSAAAKVPKDENDELSAIETPEPEEDEWEEIPESAQEDKDPLGLDLRSTAKLRSVRMSKKFTLTPPLKILVTEVLDVTRAIADIGFGLGAVSCRLTPKQCEILMAHHQLSLEKHGRINRNLRRDYVETYVADMEAGTFIPHPYGLAFFPDGTLANGYHRCQACIESGIPLETTLYLGVTLSMVSAMDLGRGRDLGAVLNLNGFTVKNLAWRRGVARFTLMGGRHIPKLTVDEDIILLTRFAEAIEFVKQNVGIRSKDPVSNAPIAAGIVRAYYAEPRDRLRAFCEAVGEKVVRDPETDGIVIPFLRWVNAYYATPSKDGKRIVQGSEAHRDSLYKITQKAVDKFCRKVSNKQLSLTKRDLEQGDRYPLPITLFDETVPLRIRCMAQHGGAYRSALLTAKAEERAAAKNTTKKKRK